MGGSAEELDIRASPNRRLVHRNVYPFHETFAWGIYTHSGGAHRPRLLSPQPLWSQGIPLRRGISYIGATHPSLDRSVRAASSILARGSGLGAGVAGM